MDGIRNRLLGLNQKKILKPDAVPSVNLPLQDNRKDVSSRSERKRKRSILKGTKIRLKCLMLEKACVTTAMEPFTTSKTGNICSSCFETQKENTCFKCQRFGHSKTNCRGTFTCARCAVAGHESTGCTAVEKCVNCQGQHTSFSRSCPKWKEVVATKYHNNISFPEARRLVKAQAPPDGRSYASVVEKNHPVYQTTNCSHCNHVVTMLNFPSTSKSPEPVAIASSSGTKNKNILPKSSSPTSEVLPDSQDSSGFTIVNRKKKT
ncbi:hypothetical protein AVEN_231933-1 [Araneus ventricosus]|uniref:CCHC-type domain-containing protein n=1 Tax=Araneus ventricosus TaxID=182803 RepID=A0A4Y2LQT2_ARAVE|nr:hypothetical protein AVEN_231933-1 [Araneus ventricosus]